MILIKSVISKHYNIAHGQICCEFKMAAFAFKKRSSSHIVGQGIVYLDMCNLKTGEMLTIRKLIMSSSCI